MEVVEDDPDDWENAPPPPTTETREEFLDSLRQSIAAVQAGQKGRPLKDVMDEIAKEFNLPPVKPE